MWGISAGFPLANHFDLPGSQSIFDNLRILRRVHTHLLVKMDPTTKGIWVEHPLTLLPH